MRDTSLFLPVEDISVAPEYLSRFEKEESSLQRVAKSLEAVFCKDDLTCYRPMKVKESSPGRYLLTGGFLAFVGCQVWGIKSFPCVIDHVDTQQYQNEEGGERGNRLGH